MAEPSKPLGHPTLHGLAALATIAGFLLSAYTFYLAVWKPSPPPPGPAYNQNVNAAANSTAELANSGLSSVDESYAGIHKYFNDWKPLAVISAILILGGLTVLARGRRAEETGTRPPSP